MLHKSPTYYLRQMSSSSLIFSMGAISMKVNPVFVSILIIATSLAIHTLVHLYLAITSALGRSELGSYRGPHTFSSGVSARRHAAVWNGAPIAALTPSLRCLHPLSWGGLILGSYQGPHTFSKVSSPVVMGRSDLGLISRPSHLL